MVNTGAFRQTIPPGPIRKADILGVLPFDNSLLRLSLGGAALQAYSNSKERVFYGGARRDATGVLLLDSTGLPLEPAKEYRVLMNSFLFGASPSLKASVKSSGAAASDWLAPLFDWLKAHPSDKDNPLEKMLTRGNP
jgi:2',3'-cyclic-nucleotide 2'-phosphodiesterase (5'-nucleotidase family)